MFRESRKSASKALCAFTSDEIVASGMVTALTFVPFSKVPNQVSKAAPRTAGVPAALGANRAGAGAGAGAGAAGGGAAAAGGWPGGWPGGGPNRVCFGPCATACVAAAAAAGAADVADAWEVDCFCKASKICCSCWDCC